MITGFLTLLVWAWALVALACLVIVIGDIWRERRDRAPDWIPDDLGPVKFFDRSDVSPGLVTRTPR